MKQNCKCLLYKKNVLDVTVKFLIVAASPIEAAPQTFKKKSFFLTKVFKLEDLQLKPQGDF